MLGAIASPDYSRTTCCLEKCGNSLSHGVTAWGSLVSDCRHGAQLFRVGISSLSLPSLPGASPVAVRLSDVWAFPRATWSYPRQRVNFKVVSMVCGCTGGCVLSRTPSNIGHTWATHSVFRSETKRVTRQKSQAYGMSSGRINSDGPHRLPQTSQVPVRTSS